MNSALSLVLGVSVLATVVGCGGGNSDGAGGSGPLMVGGGAGGAAAGTSSTAGASVLPNGGADAMLPEGVPLTPTDGWVDGKSNTLGIQGAMFEYADDTSAMGPPAIVSDFTGMNACIKGVAAKVNLTCTPVAPATDCYGTYWGAAIGLNLNQPNVTDATTGVTMGGTPVAFDASALTGFAFEITGGPTGSMIPTTLRFKVEDASGEYCTAPKGGVSQVKLGVNKFLFSDLVTKCWTSGGVPATGAKAGLIKIGWQVVTVDKSSTPFDFCVSNVRALQ